MPLSPEELAKLVNEYRAESDEGHTRLRTDLRALHDHTEMALATARSRTDLLENRIGTVADTPPQAARLQFSTGVVVAIISVTVSLMVTVIGVSNRVTNRIDALSTRMDEQSDKQKTDRDNAAKLSDERYAASQKSIDALTRQQEVLKYELQRLREDVTKGKPVK